ncbi:hypothetical protein B0H12DRAFT_1126218 [Mycena haematopus]|nr:hypothetical protein B0H12DRAFT_1126218 [Mycena haematopus]
MMNCCDENFSASRRKFAGHFGEVGGRSEQVQVVQYPLKFCQLHPWKCKLPRCEGAE